MPTSYSDRLADYVDVKERIRLFYERHPDGRLTTPEMYMQEDPDGKVRVWGRALAYRTPDDPFPGDGWSYMEVPGTTPYTRGSEIENVQTSAIGRAIGSLGIGIEKSFASQDEIDAKAGESERKEPDVGPATAVSPEGLIGIVSDDEAWLDDFQLRLTPSGAGILGFRLKDKKGGAKKGQKVIAQSPLSEALAAFRDEIIGTTATCWGTLTNEEFTPKGTRRTVPYQVLHLSRIKGPFGEFPKSEIAPGQETLPLTDEEKAAIAGTAK